MNVWHVVTDHRESLTWGRTPCNPELYPDATEFLPELFDVCDLVDRVLGC